MERFSRFSRLAGEENLGRLREASVTVFGVGAVGGWATEMLARCGIGKFRLIDPDCISVTNINRHVCALDSTVGIPKTEAVKARIRDINPAAEVEIFRVAADSTNIGSLLAHRPDIVIDAIDSLGPKTDLLEYAFRNSIRVISSMGAALKTDLTAIKSGDISRTSVCPLARNLRQALRKRGIDKGIRCVWSTELPDNNALICAEDDPDRNENPVQGAKRSLGSYPHVTAVFGIMIADEAIKAIIKKVP